jgi:hypothetical protein
VLYGPQDSCQTIRTVRKYTQKFITAVTSISVPINVVRQPWNACQYSQKLQLLSSSISVHIKCCTTSTNPYGMACSSLLSAASKSVLLFALGCVLSFSKCCLFSSARPLSCSWHLTKDLTLASHQRSLLLASHQESLDLGISPKILSLVSHQVTSSLALSCSLNKNA